MVDILAGFECGHLGWNGHDLLVTTAHLPDRRMGEHFRIVAEHGMARARDGLPWRHDPRPRIEVARRAGVSVIWDLNHFDPPPDATAHAVRAARAADPSAPFWICPVNEPSLYPALCGMPWQAAVDLAIHMVRVARDHHPNVRVLTTEPLTGIGERQFAATDALVQAVPVDVVGLNYYPHTARAALSKAIAKTARRYGKPVMVSETSWHDGHPVHHRRYPGWNKADWFQHVVGEVDAAVRRGSTVAGLCWYPVIDSPPWHHPRARGRWSHGLIRADLGLDPALAEAVRRHAARTRQLVFPFAPDVRPGRVA